MLFTNVSNYLGFIKYIRNLHTMTALTLEQVVHDLAGAAHVSVSSLDGHHQRADGGVLPHNPGSGSPELGATVLYVRHRHRHESLRHEVSILGVGGGGGGW